jgi:superfamily II DNA or RNA helicase
MKMRDYQEEAYDATIEVFKEVDSAVCVMATGLGKTVYGCHVVDHFVPKGRIIWLAHREELILQAQSSLETITGHSPDIEMGDNWATAGFLKSKIVVSSIQTQIAGREGGRMTRFDPDEFSLIVIDDAHHSISDSYGKVIDYYMQNPDIKLLGLTATPDRHDKKAMGQRFKKVAYSYDIHDGIEDGWLVPIEQRSVFVNSLDYSEVRSACGELNGKDLATVLEYEENLHAIADPTVQLTGDKKTLIFAATVAQAERLTEIINRHKPMSANFVCGNTPKDTRRNMFGAYAEKQFQYLINVGVATEGFDDPGIECVVLARPTKSRCLFTQMVGRGTRPLAGIVDQFGDPIQRREAIEASGKPAVEVMDFVGNAGRHKLITTADILGGKYDDEVVELAAANASEKSARDGKPADVASELMQAEREIERRNKMRDEAEWRDKIVVGSKFSTATVNPFDMLDITPHRESVGHKTRPPTMKQLAYLKYKGVDSAGLSHAHASQIIGTLMTRWKNKICTYKQANKLKQHGLDATNMTFEKASKFMNELANNPEKKWRTPARWRELPEWIGKKK